jgi:hypothetical protein
VRHPQQKANTMVTSLGRGDASYQVLGHQDQEERGAQPSISGTEYYLSRAEVDREVHDKSLSIRGCIKQLNFSRQKLKDVVANAKEYRGQYEAEIAEAIVEKRNPRFKDGEIFDPVEKEILVERELKTR